MAEQPMVPDEYGFAFPTWEAMLRNGFDGVSAAYERRKRIVVAAHKAGLSYATIGELVGMSSTGVWKIATGGRGKPSQAELLASVAGGGSGA